MSSGAFIVIGLEILTFFVKLQVYENLFITWLIIKVDSRHKSSKTSNRKSARMKRKKGKNSEIENIKSTWKIVDLY